MPLSLQHQWQRTSRHTLQIGSHLCRSLPLRAHHQDVATGSSTSGAPPKVENRTTTLKALIQVSQPPLRGELGRYTSNMESLLQPIALRPTPQHHSRPMLLWHGPHLLSPPTTRLPAADAAVGTPLQSHHRRHPVPGVHHRTRKHKPAVPLPTGNWPGTLRTHPIRRKPQHTRLHR